MRIPQSFGGFNPPQVAVILIVGHIKNFLDGARKTSPDEPLYKKVKRKGGTGYTLRLWRTDPHVITYEVRAESYVLGLLVTFIWKRGGTTFPVNLFVLRGEIPIGLNPGTHE